MLRYFCLLQIYLIPSEIHDMTYYPETRKHESTQNFLTYPEVKLIIAQVI